MRGIVTLHLEVRRKIDAETKRIDAEKKAEVEKELAAKRAREAEATALRL